MLCFLYFDLPLEIGDNIVISIILSLTLMGIVVAIVSIVLSAIGFGSAGPIAGSVAAGVQSVCYGGAVKASSAFAVAQSAAMTSLL